MSKGKRRNYGENFSILKADVVKKVFKYDYVVLMTAIDTDNAPLIVHSCGELQIIQTRFL